MPDSLLTPAELSARYRGTISVRTLANWRSAGVGPAFVKIGGRVLYRMAAVMEWENLRTKVTAAMQSGLIFYALCALAACRPI